MVRVESDPGIVTDATPCPCTPLFSIHLNLIEDCVLLTLPIASRLSERSAKDGEI